LNLVVVGDSLLDRDVHGYVGRLSPDAPVPVLDQHETVVRPGGAALAAALAAADGHQVTLVSALGADGPGTELREALDRAGVEVLDLGLRGATPEKIRFFAGQHQLMRLDRGAGVPAPHAAGASARAAVGWADAVLVSDYGRGVAADQALRSALAELAGRIPVVWDPHPRGPHPVAGVTVATPNETEATHFGAGGREEPSERAEALRELWRARAVCVTRGARGALLCAAGAAPLALPTEPAVGGDSCGAGDRFASRLAGALGQGRSLADGAREAVAVSARFVAAGGARGGLALGQRGGALGPSREESSASRRPEAVAIALAESVRAAGGTVVATGGCFDLLHTGHVLTLQAARRLGDCLIVCLNSDASVRRLKGPDRPLVGEADRAAVLNALECVDAVLIFGEDTPGEALRALRPHLWVKGGDYEGKRLPEADVLEEWGGRAFVLPYLDGRSTTRLIEEARTSV
jgi:rfaE bifunctional protein nucleotidyltransferase chain/domain/rfaE bifunctional protein kinase chain/domain